MDEVDHDGDAHLALLGLGLDAARLLSTTPGAQLVLFCSDANRNGCLDEAVLSFSVVVWLP